MADESFLIRPSKQRDLDIFQAVYPTRDRRRSTTVFPICFGLEASHKVPAIINRVPGIWFAGNVGNWSYTCSSRSRETSSQTYPQINKQDNIRIMIWDFMCDDPLFNVYLIVTQLHLQCSTRKRFPHSCIILKSTNARERETETLTTDMRQMCLANWVYWDIRITGYLPTQGRGFVRSMI